jgi:hypothetical protein
MPKTPKPLERYIIRFFSGRNVLDNLTEIIKPQSELLSDSIGKLREVMDNASITAQNSLKQGSTKDQVMTAYKQTIIQQIMNIDDDLELEDNGLSFIIPSQNSGNTSQTNPSNDIDDMAMSGGDMDDIINFKNNLYESLEVLASKCSEFLIDKVNDYFTRQPTSENKQKAIYQIYSILFNFYKIMNRYLNACRTISDSNGNLYLTLTSTRDLNTSLITLSQQIAFYKSRFGNTTSIPQVDTIFAWVIQNTPYIQNPGSRGRRRAAIQTEIVTLMNRLTIQTTTITPISSLQFLKLLQNLLATVLNTPINPSGLNLIQVFKNIHQIVNNGSEDFKENIMLSWSDTLAYEIDDAPSIKYSITDNGDIVYPVVTTSTLTFINEISSLIMGMVDNSTFISTFCALNNIFQTTSITFDPIVALSPPTFQAMGLTINTPNIGGVNYNILTGKLDIDNAPFKKLENVNNFMQLAFQNTNNNISQNAQLYVTSLGNGSILFDPMIVEIPNSVFTNPNYFGSANDPLFLYIYPLRLGQYQIPDSNNFSWNLGSPLPKNNLLQGGKRKKKSKKNRKRKKKTIKLLRSSLKKALRKIKKINKSLKLKRKKRKTRNKYKKKVFNN